MGRLAYCRWTILAALVFQLIGVTLGVLDLDDEAVSTETDSEQENDASGELEEDTSGINRLEITLSEDQIGIDAKTHFTNALFTLAVRTCGNVDSTTYMTIVQSLVTGYWLRRLKVKSDNLDYLHYKSSLEATTQVLHRCLETVPIIPKPASKNVSYDPQDSFTIHVNLEAKESLKDELRRQTRRKCMEVEEYLKSFPMPLELKQLVQTLWHVFTINYAGCAAAYRAPYEPARLFVLFQTFLLNPLVHEWNKPNDTTRQTAAELRRFNNYTRSWDRDWIRSCAQYVYIISPMDTMPCFEVIPEDNRDPFL